MNSLAVARTRRWFRVYVGLIVVGWGAGFTSAALADGTKTAKVLMVVCVLSIFSAAIFGLVWLHEAWSALPSSDRLSSSGESITPGGAVGRLFIPCYNLYWVYACNVGLAKSYNRALERRRSSVRAGVGRAQAAAFLQMIPNLNWVVGPFLWIAHMASINAACVALESTSEISSVAHAFE